MKKFAKVFARVAMVVFFVSVGPAWAKNEAAVEDKKSADIHCSETGLTSERFVDMLYTIVSHGDLRDVDFIESTFQTKFTTRPSASETQSPKTGALHYEGNSILGFPAIITLDVSHNPRMKRTKIGFLKVSIDSDNCLEIKSQDIEKKFGAKFNDSTMKSFARDKANDVLLREMRINIPLKATETIMGAVFWVRKATPNKLEIGIENQNWTSND